MRTSIVSTGLALTIGLLLAACETSEQKKRAAIQERLSIADTVVDKESFTPVERPHYVVNGEVILVNPRLRFVVIECELDQFPEKGQILNVYRNGLKVGEIRVTGPSRNTTTAADIQAGQLAVGDDVRSD